MKATGITRKVDELGRIVLPMEIRRNKGINFGDPMEIFTTEDGIVLRRFEAVDDALSVAKRLKEILDNEKNPQYKKQIIDKVEGYIEAVKCDISEKEKLFEK
ncbi:hypothetical protein DSECCO2_208830 [anaerobic digester metagenome]